MKKGFTLIELLAVIVILAIISLIAVPSVLSTITSARQSAFSNSVNSIIKATEEVVFSEISNGTNKDIFIKYTDGAEIIYPSGKVINYEGSKPKDGAIIIHIDGGVTLALHDGINCVYKKKTDNSTTVVQETKDACNQRVFYYQASAPFDNLITNGDFSSGTSGWLSAASTGTLSIRDNALVHRITQIQSFAGIRQNIIPVIGRRYYLSTNVKTFRSHSFVLYIGNSSVNTGIVTNTDSFVKVSGIATATGVDLPLFYDNSSIVGMNIGSETYYKEPYIIDLTSSFGAGNEPTKEEMDHNLNKVWINSTTQIPMKFTAGGWRNF